MRPLLLWVGDAVADTGFSRVTHAICDRLVRTFDVRVLGVNYYGDPHPHAYPIYPARINESQDMMGHARILDVGEALQPNIICVLNDPWNVELFCGHKYPVPLTAYMPVDGKNMKEAPGLNKLARAMFYTKFGLDQARAGGYTGQATIIPHGVDTATFHPVDQIDARRRLGLAGLPPGAFIVGNVNRNQPRKRLDLTIAWFANFWERQGKPDNVFLLLHCAKQDIGWDVLQLAKYFGLGQNRVIISAMRSPSDGIASRQVNLVYNALDVLVSTTMGEGWGLTAHEAMAAGKACLLPANAAFTEWPRGAVRLVPCSEIAVTSAQVNVVGMVPDRESWIDALAELYKDRDLRVELGRLALERATKPEFTWDAIALQFQTVFNDVLAGVTVTGPVA